MNCNECLCMPGFIRISIDLFFWIIFFFSIQFAANNANNYLNGLTIHPDDVDAHTESDSTKPPNIFDQHILLKNEYDVQNAHISHPSFMVFKLKIRWSVAASPLITLFWELFTKIFECFAAFAHHYFIRFSGSVFGVRFGRLFSKRVTLMIRWCGQSHWMTDVENVIKECARQRETTTLFLFVFCCRFFLLRRCAVFIFNNNNIHFTSQLKS